MRQIGCDMSTRQRAAHLVAHSTRAAQKKLLAQLRFLRRWLCSRPALRFDPGIVSRRLLGHYEDAHVSVLSSTKLCALALKVSRVACLNSEEIWMAGNEVDFAVQRWDLEGMHHIARFELDVDRAMRRNVNLIGRRKLPFQWTV